MRVNTDSAYDREKHVITSGSLLADYERLIAVIRSELMSMSSSMPSGCCHNHGHPFVIQNPASGHRRRLLDRLQSKAAGRAAAAGPAAIPGESSVRGAPPPPARGAQQGHPQSPEMVLAQSFTFMAAASLLSCARASVGTVNTAPALFSAARSFPALLREADTFPSNFLPSAPKRERNVQYPTAEPGLDPEG